MTNPLNKEPQGKLENTLRLMKLKTQYKTYGVELKQYLEFIAVKCVYSKRGKTLNQ